jgi:2Fe-2S ferredoxin
VSEPVPKVFYLQPDGTERVVAATAGESVMRTAVRHGVAGIVGQCGGTLSCATCHVFLADENAADFPPVTENEDDMLEVAAAERRPSSRLSCQLTLAAGQEVRVIIPHAQL